LLLWLLLLLLRQALLRSCMSYSLPVFGRLADVLSRLDARVLEGRAHMKLTRRLHVLLIDLSILARRCVEICRCSSAGSAACGLLHAAPLCFSTIQIAQMV
jgi:hypothetical protein